MIQEVDSKQNRFLVNINKDNELGINYDLAWFFVLLNLKKKSFNISV